MPPTLDFARIEAAAHAVAATRPVTLAVEARLPESVTCYFNVAAGAARPWEERVGCYTSGNPLDELWRIYSYDGVSPGQEILFALGEALGIECKADF